MLIKRSRIELFALIVALCGVAACGDDAPAVEGQGDGDGASGKSHYTASVSDSSTDMKIPNLKVHVLDNQTGEKTGQVGTTDANGGIAFDDVKVDEDGMFAVVVEGVPGMTGYLDTFQYNLNPNAQNDILRVVGSGAIALTTAAANFEANSEAGPISGAIFTGTGAADRKPACGLTVELADMPDAPVKTNMECTKEDLCIRYFFDQRIPDFAASFTSKENGRYFVANAPAGEHTVNIKANGETIATTRVVVIPRKAGTTGETISVANVYLGAGDTNPAASTCE